MSIRKVLAIDIDDVLIFFIFQVLMYFIRPLCIFHNKNYGTNLSEKDFWSYEFYNIWGGNYDDVFYYLKQCQIKVKLFFESTEFNNVFFGKFLANISTWFC